MKLIRPEIRGTDFHHLRAAEGWLALGNAIEANAELEAVSTECRARPDFLLLRLAVLQDPNVWKKILSLAETLTELMPKTSDCWLLRAEALHELGRTEEACRLLTGIADGFAGVYQIPYALARYSAASGRKKEARSWLELAFNEADENARLKLLALDDPALNDLWAEGL